MVVHPVVKRVNEGVIAKETDRGRSESFAPFLIDTRMTRHYNLHQTSVLLTTIFE
jgi:hypothetical protein